MPTFTKPTIPAFIVVVLLIYLGLALFGSAIGINIRSDNPFAELLKNLTLMAASYFVGTTQGSAKKDEIIANSPPVVSPPSTTTTTTVTESEQKE